jgi:AcrR family transcriptional regulator
MARGANAAEGTAATRELLLRAALHAFSEKGFDGASTREIAAAAGVNHGLIPYYFRTKLKLWQASVDLAFGDMKAGLQQLLADPSITDDRERARRMIRAHVRWVARNPEFVRLMHEEGKRRGPRTRWIVDTHVKPLYEVVTDLLQRGSLQVDTAPVHIFYIVAGAVGVLFHQAEECKRLTGVDAFDPDVVEEHARVVERMLLGAPADGGRG